MMTKTERIAFDWENLQVRQIVIDAYGRTRVPSYPAKHLKRFTLEAVQAAWEKKGYRFKSYIDKVLIMEYRPAKRVEAAA